MAQHHRQVVLGPGADVGQNGGSVRGAEAEAELLLSQVSVHAQGSQRAFHRRRRHAAGHEVIAHQCAAFKVPAHI